MRNNKKLWLLFCTLIVSVFIFGCNKHARAATASTAWQQEFVKDFSSVALTMTDHPFVTINGNQPSFSTDELTTKEYETYSQLDRLGRCGVAEACIGPALMPTEERGEIGMIKPTGWHTVKYDIVDGKYLYNRCHLIGYQLSGENANEKNLITGTRYMNVEGMLPFENQVADYIRDTGNHVMYRVTPVFTGSNLLADGVVMEARSVEDNGKGVCFHVFVYNKQPGIFIDYETGGSYPLECESSIQTENDSMVNDMLYVLNIRSQKIHTPDCDSVSDISPQNKKEYRGILEDLLADGYTTCRNCNPQ